MIGRRIEVIADLGRVRAVRGGHLVADHERVWARHQTSSDPEHVAAARALRRERLEIVRPAAEPEVELRLLAERARAESWLHEEFLIACLQREVSARGSHGGEGRIRAARFPARKSLEEFDFEPARGLKRDLIAHLGTGETRCWHCSPVTSASSNSA